VLQVNKFVVWILILSLAITGCSSPAVKPEVGGGTQVTGATTPTLPVTPTETPAAAASASPTADPTASPTATLTASPTVNAAATEAAKKTANPAKVEDVIEFEMKGAFNFFWEQANTELTSAGYGLIRDRFPGSEGIASMAAVGFGLTAYLIGVEKGYITQQQGSERVNKTLDTLLKMERVEGFFFHFVDMKTGKRAWNSEVSNIDTSILLMGVLSAGQYFGGEIAVKAKQLYDAVNWPWFLDKTRNMFYMAYRPEKGFEGHWDFYAEQLMLYVLAAGSDTHPMDDTAYYTFTRHSAQFGDGKPFIHSWFGSIFTYQFTHAWIDFRGYSDAKKVNWFDNSVEASLAQFNFAAAMAPDYKTLGPNAWGLTACDGPGGYNGLYGAPPSGFDNQAHFVDDTIPPSGAIGSIIFLPQQARQAMLNYNSIEKLKGKYGFVDAYNLSKNWVATDVIGIDKGISLLMLANYQNDLVYKFMMKNGNILKGLNRLQITKNQ
jgi:hypothetical protein